MGFQFQSVLSSRGCSSASGRLPWDHPSQFAHNPWNCWPDIPAQQRRQEASFLLLEHHWYKSVSLDGECRIHSLPTSKVWRRVFLFFFQIPLNAGIKEGCKSWKCGKSRCSEALIHASSCLPPLLRLYHRELEWGKGKHEQPSMA